MKLEEYIKVLESCPRNQLSEEHGVRDNWPISFGIPLQKLVRILKDSGKFIYVRDRDQSQDWNYIPGTVFVGLFPHRAMSLFDYMLSETDKTEHDRRNQSYKSSMMLHPYQDGSKSFPGKRMEVTDNQNPMVLAIKDIADLVIANKVPTFMPRSIGERYTKIAPIDFSKFVYYLEAKR